MNLRRLLLVVLTTAVLALLAACSSNHPFLTGGVRIIWTDVAYEAKSGFNKPLYQAVQDQATWEVMWRKVKRYSKKAGPAPKVDFSRYMLLVVAAGVQKNNGYEVLIKRIIESPGFVEVDVNILEPGLNCKTKPVMISPVYVARMKKSYKTVNFNVYPIIAICENKGSSGWF